jgi:hypothetical protein
MYNITVFLCVYVFHLRNWVLGVSINSCLTDLIWFVPVHCINENINFTADHTEDWYLQENTCLDHNKIHNPYHYRTSWRRGKGPLVYLYAAAAQSDLRPNTAYPDWEFFVCIFSLPPGKCRDIISIGCNDVLPNASKLVIRVTSYHSTALLNVS